MTIKTGCRRISIVTPVFNEEHGLLAYEAAITTVLLPNPDCIFEVIIVDDGSTDASWPIICAMSVRNPVFRGVRLSRNHGAHVALSAGILEAEGDAVVTLACDLQDPPETVLEFIAHWRNGAEIVWGHRRSRQDATWRMALSRLFFHLLSRYAMPNGSKFTTGSFLLMDAKVAKCFNRFEERHRITFALVAWTGFNQDVVYYDRRSRKIGVSKWSFAQMVRTMYDAFVGFSLVPVRGMTVVGVGVAIFSLLLLIYLFTTWLMGGVTPGWTGQMFAMSFFFGVQFLLMGVVGEYLFRIYGEVVRRPLFFVSHRTDSDERMDRR